MADVRSFLILNFLIITYFYITYFKYGRQGAIFKYNLTLNFTTLQHGC